MTKRTRPIELKNQISGNHAFDQDTILHGQVTGSAIVGIGVHLELRGQICGDLEVGQGADVVIYGQVIGTVTNHGGHVLIVGDVGAIDDRSDRPGKISLAGAAVVRRKLTAKAH